MAAGGVAGVGGAFGLAYASSPGFRRSVTFWTTVTPFVVEHQCVKLRARCDGCDDAERDRRLDAFHARTASCVVDVILSLGVIYVKLGQVVSTIGAGIFEDGLHLSAPAAAGRRAAALARRGYRDH